MYSTFLLAVVVVLRMRTASSGIVDDQACAKYVHEQCKCDINIESSKNKQVDHLCKNLQACADCMATPRCESSYVDQYLALLQFLFFIIGTSKETEFCPHMSFGISYKGPRKICKGKGKVYDQLGNQCSCKDGHYFNCSRVRKEFTQMSFEERRRFVDAYYKATTDPLLKDDFEKILSGHGDIPSNLLHDSPEMFFPWHRWFLLQAENFLRQIDCRVTIPYYQWTAAGENLFRTTNPKDVWSDGPQGIGGNGVPPDNCVMDGKFRKGNWYMPLDKGGGCLKRKFNKKCKFYKEKNLLNLIESNSFKSFYRVALQNLHSPFHLCTGGNMKSSRTAGNAPEVLLHHSFLDKIWNQWQSKGDSFKSRYYPAINFKMPLADIYPWQIIDNYNLPGNVGVVYQTFKEPLQQKRMKESFEGEGIGDDEGNTTDEDNFTDEQENDRELPGEQADGNVED